MPDWTDEIRRRLAAARLDGADEADVIDELAQHLDDRHRDLRAAGHADDEARRLALAELDDGDDAIAHGAPSPLGERLRALATRRPPAAVPIGARAGRGRLGALWGDLRFGARLLRRAPGFTLVAVLTLGLGVGANTAIFSVVNALLLRPLPGIERQAELVLLGRTQDGGGFDTFAHPDFADYARDARTLAGLAAWYETDAHLATGTASERVRLQLVSGGYFPLLGTAPARGRLLQPGVDDAPAAAPAVVLAHRFWERRFDGDPDAVGRTVTLNGQPYTVVGVAPAGFGGVEVDGHPDAFAPMATVSRLLPYGADLLDERGAVWLRMVGRLAPDATAAAARAELGTIAARLQRQHPASNEGRGIVVAEGIGLTPDARAEVRGATAVLLGMVALVLLIGCANVANLLLARGAARERELALRAALGAGRGRIVRQLLAEGLLLAALGGAAGLALGWITLLGMRRLPAFADSGLLANAALDARVLAFTAAAALLSGLLFAVPPALRASRASAGGALRSGPGGGGAAQGRRLRQGLVAAQLALSVVLLAAAGLFVRTLQALHAIEPGYETERLLVASVDVGLQGYDEARGRRFLAELEQRARALPGVQSAALGTMLPLGGGGWDTQIRVADRPPLADEPGVKTDMNAVSPGYFAALDIPLLRGRVFGPADDERAPAVAVINAALAERLWPGENPIGRRLRRGSDSATVEVVGVVPTARYRSLLEPPRPFMYVPAAQAYQARAILHLRSVGDAAALAPLVTALVASLDRDLPVYRVGTLAAQLERSLVTQRTAAILVGGYGALALALAAIGLYGTMSYTVSRHTRDIGIRMAVGASGDRVVRQVLGDAARVALVGTGVGLLAAVPASRLLRSQLVGVGPGDPLTLALVALLLLTVALVAALLPARRAARVAPAVALRAE